jgi:hypothetical protein
MGSNLCESADGSTSYAENVSILSIFVFQEPGLGKPIIISLYLAAVWPLVEFQHHQLLCISFCQWCQRDNAAALGLITPLLFSFKAAPFTFLVASCLTF